MYGLETLKKYNQNIFNENKLTSLLPHAALIRRATTRWNVASFLSSNTRSDNKKLVVVVVLKATTSCFRLSLQRLHWKRGTTKEKRVSLISNQSCLNDFMLFDAQAVKRNSFCKLHK